MSGDHAWSVDVVPEGFALMAVDRHERPLGIADGRPWLRAGHWRRLDVRAPMGATRPPGGPSPPAAAGKYMKLLTVIAGK